jgi:hypothetical protein
MLTGFEKNSENEHRKTGHNSTRPTPESDHRQRRQDQIGSEVLHFVVDVRTTDRNDHGRGGGQRGADDDAEREDAPEEEDGFAQRGHARQASMGRAALTLLRNSTVGGLKPFVQRPGGHPAQLVPHEAIVGVSAADSARCGDVTDRQLLAGDFHDHGCKLVDRHDLFRSDVDRTGEGGAHQAANTPQTLIDEEE